MGNIGGTESTYHYATSPKKYVSHFFFYFLERERERESSFPFHHNFVFQQIMCSGMSLKEEGLTSHRETYAVRVKMFDCHWLFMFLCVNGIKWNKGTNEKLLQFVRTTNSSRRDKCMENRVETVGIGENTLLFPTLFFFCSFTLLFCEAANSCAHCTVKEQNWKWNKWERELEGLGVGRVNDRTLFEGATRKRKSFAEFE